MIDRKQLRRMRDEIPADERKTMSGRICRTALEQVSGGEMVFVYASVGSEVDTWQLIQALQERNCKVCLPKVCGKGCMDAVLYRSGAQLLSDRFGIPVPADGAVVSPEGIDIVFVPGLAFDDSGNRIGYGGGYYDRFLARCPARRIALAFSRQIIAEIAPAEWDRPMDAIITENGKIALQPK